MRSLSGMLLSVFFLIVPSAGWAQSLDDHGDPANPDSAMYTLDDIYNRLDTGAAGTKRAGAFTEPSAGPAPTGPSLDGVMGKAPAVDDVNGASAADVLTGKTFWGLLSGGGWGLKTGNLATQTPDNTTVSQPAGYYEAFNLSTVDTDLATGNIRAGVSIFGVPGNAVVATGNAVAADVLSGKTFSNAGGAGISGTMTNVGKQDITPGTSAQTITQGYHDGTGAATGDANLVTTNIKSGVTIFGVAGDANVVDTSSGDAAAGDMLAGKKAWVDGAEVIGTAAAGDNVTGGDGLKTLTIPDGLYTGSKTATASDTDLVAGNIKKSVEIFGVTGTYEAAMVPKTGQTTSHATGDDGALQKGVAWPSPRFTDHEDGTVTDNLTGLMWLKNANNAPGVKLWADALTYCNDFVDSSGYSDWRLPNRFELESLFDLGNSYPALPSGHPFDYVQSNLYWSSTTLAGDTNFAWYVHLSTGYVRSSDKAGWCYVWPVRGGQ